MEEREHGPIKRFFRKVREIFFGKKKEKALATEEAAEVQEAPAAIEEKLEAPEAVAGKPRTQAAPESLEKPIEAETMLLPKTKIGKMIESKKIEEAEKEKKEFERKIKRKKAAKKGARKRKKKHEEIVERLGKIEEKVGRVPAVRQKFAEKRIIKKLGRIEKKISKRGKRRKTGISWKAGEEIVSTLKRIEKKTPEKRGLEWTAGKEIASTLKKIEKKTKPIEIKGTVLQLPKMAKVSVAAKPEIPKTQKASAVTLTAGQVTMPAAITPAAVEAAAPAEAAQEQAKAAEEKPFEELGLDEQIELTKRMIRRVRYEFFKRIINEDEYKHRTNELMEKLQLLEEKKKLLSERKEKPKKPREAVAAKPIAEAEKKPVEEKTAIRAALEQKAAGKVDGDTLKRIGSRLQETAAKYNIPQQTIVSGIRSLEAEKIVEDFDKLINLLEVQHGEKAVQKEEKMRFEPIPTAVAEKHKKERAKAFDKEIQQQMLETDFDRIMNFIKEKGRATAGQIARELNINPTQVRECCRILEQNSLVYIEYPPIGDIRIIDMEFGGKKQKKTKKGD